ncbi:MAG: hypothetical protein IMZ62_14800, partial [Chloroflexi bacterium]|nr:hypothetical protein [Chloroflexota bacterium]
MKRVLGVVLVFLLGGLTTFAQVPSYLNTAGEFPIAKDKIMLSVAVQKVPSMAPPDRVWFWKWAEKTMNIKFDVRHIETAALVEKMNLMFASNDLPDMFYGDMGFFTAPNLVRYGQEEKQLAALNTLIDKHAPNLRRVFSLYPSAKAMS